MNQTTPPRPLFDIWPSLADRLPWLELGEFPTPVRPLAELARALGRPELPLFEKRDDLSSPVYGGNKVRTLEALFAQAKAEDATHVFSTGAYGSNHAVATVLHARRAGLTPGAILFPQPPSWAALENLRVTVSAQPVLRAVAHWSLLPYAMIQTAREQRRLGHRPFIMVPGGATPRGALGYVSAAIELGRQVEAGLLPRPEQVLIGVGSTCTSAGLLVGFALAARLGIGFRDHQGRPAPPTLVSVRVTPWPVTSKLRIVGLAVRASELLAELSAVPSVALSRAELGRHFEVTGEYLGRGYGIATSGGREALELWREHAGHELDTTYSGKAAAALVARARLAERGPVLLWATKSSVPLPPIDAAALRSSPALVRRWIGKTERTAASELPADYVALGAGS